MATTNPDANWSVMEHLVDVEQGSVVPSRQWVDTPGRLRTEYLASYEGLALTSVLGEESASAFLSARTGTGDARRRAAERHP